MSVITADFKFDLRQQTLRELNQALHDLTPESNARHWHILNPDGGHAIAAAVDAPVTIEIEGMSDIIARG